MPCKAMQKLSVKKGCMLRCACDPPTLVIEAGFIAAIFVGAR
jgi:hypothetical protein